MKRLILWLFLLMIPVVSYAHGGGTDANGGHYDKSTGQYHYHHGYSAHQHPNGVCPYDYKDKTGQNSGTSGGIGSYSRYTTAPRPTAAPKTQKAKSNASGITFALIATGGAAAVAVVSSSNAKKRKAAERARLEKEAAEREKKISFYKNNDLRTLTGMPDQYYVDDRNVPMEKDKPRGYLYGKSLDVYVSHSSSSNVYHSRDCQYARQLVNAISANRTYYLNTRRPCTLCSPPPLPYTEWYTKYLMHVHECEKLGIEPIREPHESQDSSSHIYFNCRD